MYKFIIGIILIVFTAFNILRLARSARLLKAVNRNRFLKCAATVVRRFGVINMDIFSTEYAKAEYTVNGEPVVGRLFAPVRTRLAEGQQLEVIAARDFPGIFACSEKHIKSAFAKYVFLTVLTSAMTLFCVVSEVLFRLYGAG